MKRKGTLIAVVVVVLLLAVTAGLVFYIVSGRNSGSDEPQRREVLVTEANADEALGRIADEADLAALAEAYTATMNSDWTFPDGASPSVDAYVENQSAFNSLPVWFDVVLSDTGETIYESPVLPPGAVLEGFSLDTPLEAGTYACTLTYHQLNNVQDQVELSTLTIGIRVIVES